jgi:hypothetical protein
MLFQILTYFIAGVIKQKYLTEKSEMRIVKNCTERGVSANLELKSTIDGR